MKTELDTRVERHSEFRLTFEKKVLYMPQSLGATLIHPDTVHDSSSVYGRTRQ